MAFATCQGLNNHGRLVATVLDSSDKGQSSHHRESQNIGIDPYTAILPQSHGGKCPICLQWDLSKNVKEGSCELGFKSL